MFHETEKNDHGLPRPPFKSIAVPRPIGWNITVEPSGAAGDSGDRSPGLEGATGAFGK